MCLWSLCEDDHHVTAHVQARTTGLWGTAQGSRLTSRADADVITAKVQGRRGTVVKVETQTRRERPPLLYDLTLPAASRQHALRLLCGAHAHPGAIPLRKDLHHLPAHRVAPSLQQPQQGTAGPCRGHQRHTVFSLYSHDPGPGKRPSQLTSRHVDDPRKSPTTTPSSPQRSTWTQRHSPLTRSACTTSSPAASSPLFTRTPTLKRTTVITEVEGERFTTRGTVVLTHGWQEGLTPPGAQDRPPTMPQR